MDLSPFDECTWNWCILRFRFCTTLLHRVRNSTSQQLQKVPPMLLWFLVFFGEFPLQDNTYTTERLLAQTSTREHSSMGQTVQCHVTICKRVRDIFKLTTSSPLTATFRPYMRRSHHGCGVGFILETCNQASSYMSLPIFHAIMVPFPLPQASPLKASTQAALLYHTRKKCLSSDILAVDNKIRQTRGRVGKESKPRKGSLLLRTKCVFK